LEREGAHIQDLRVAARDTSPRWRQKPRAAPVVLAAPTLATGPASAPSTMNGRPMGGPRVLRAFRTAILGANAV